VNRFLKTLALWVAALGAALLLCAAALLASAALILRPAPGEWTETLRWGRWQHDVSMPTLLRIATHPFTLGLLEGRRMRTRFGPVQWTAGERPGTWSVVCAPCAFERREVGGDRIELARVAFTLERDLSMRLHGNFELGEPGRAVRGRWNARIDTDRAELRFILPDTPLEHAFGLFAGAVPELARARIEGRIGGSARLRLPSRELSVRPRIEGFSVAGLGTAALLGAVPACSAGRSAGTQDRAPGRAPDRTTDKPFGPWLPRAVVAAEDQRFHEHAGFDLNEILAAWAGNGRATSNEGIEGELSDVGGRPRGASTLSQQLAKLVYTGDRASHVRKLRELLYAVELDRTLGKARVLNLYLAIAPWGDGRCGAHAAAQALLGKPAVALTPVEAAWLASLLRNPDAALARMVRSSEVDVRRVGAIIDAMRPMPLARRLTAQQVLDTWRPDWLGPPLSPAPAEAATAPAPRWHGAPDAGPGEATGDDATSVAEAT
jgi:Transglycosylase